MAKEVSPAASAGDQKTTETMDVEAMSPAARLFHSSRFNCCIISIMGIKTTINPDIVKAGLTETLLKHPRFSSKLVSPLISTQLFFFPRFLPPYIFFQFYLYYICLSNLESKNIGEKVIIMELLFFKLRKNVSYLLNKTN